MGTKKSHRNTPGTNVQHIPSSSSPSGAGRPLPPSLRGLTHLLHYLKTNEAGAESAGGRNGFEFLQLQSLCPFLGTHRVLFKYTAEVLNQGR